MARPRIPSLSASLNTIGYDDVDGQGIEFYPFEEFLSADETRSWYRAWTGNAEVDASEYLVFGQDGTGGYAAFWLRRPVDDLLEQPIVFLGSEGETGVVARNFRDYLWLLAGGCGPCEAVTRSPGERRPLPQFEQLARQHAGNDRRTVDEVLSSARAEFPKFSEEIFAVCK